jgi:hypothetical protein
MSESPAQIVIDPTAEPGDGPVPKRVKTGNEAAEDAVRGILASARDRPASRSAIEAVRAKLARVPNHFNIALGADEGFLEGAEEDGFYNFDVPAKSTSFWRAIDLDFFVHTNGIDVFVCSRADGQRDILLFANGEDDWHPGYFDVVKEVGTQGLAALAKTGRGLPGFGKVAVRVRPAAADGMTLEVFATDEEAFSELYTVTVACGVVRALCDTDDGEMPVFTDVSVSCAF